MRAARRRGIHVGGGGKHPGNHSQIVAGENEKTQRGDEGKEEAPLLTGHPDHELLEAADHDLEEVLGSSGDEFEAPGPKRAHHDEQQHDEPGIGHVREEQELEQGVCVRRNRGPQEDRAFRGED